MPTRPHSPDCDAGHTVLKFDKYYCDGSSMRYKPSPSPAAPVCHLCRSPAVGSARHHHAQLRRSAPVVTSPSQRFPCFIFCQCSACRCVDKLLQRRILLPFVAFRWSNVLNE